MIKQGDIYWVSARYLDIAGHEQQKNRPYVVVSRDLINNLGQNIVGVPLSTKIHKANSHRILIPVQHMIKDPSATRDLSTSVALTDQIRVLDRSRLEMPKMGSLSSTAIGGLELGLVYLFDIR